MALIVRVQNITPQAVLACSDGTADYDVWVGINHRCIWQGDIKGHVRDEGAAKLLRLIADQMDKEKDRG